MKKVSLENDIHLKYYKADKMARMIMTFGEILLFIGIWYVNFEFLSVLDSTNMRSLDYSEIRSNFNNLSTYDQSFVIVYIVGFLVSIPIAHYIIFASETYIFDIETRELTYKRTLAEKRIAKFEQIEEFQLSKHSYYDDSEIWKFSIKLKSSDTLIEFGENQKKEVLNDRIQRIQQIFQTFGVSIPKRIIE